MVDKSKMKCNSPVKSDRKGKKRMVKACSGGKKKLIHYGATGYKSNYLDDARKGFKATNEN